ncbi:MAG: hypothetical protein MUC43_09140 [Pirellula sp.]|jgi:hypothetical protein|nr:hypothetical protein [Pirellula sp.]
MKIAIIVSVFCFLFRICPSSLSFSTEDRELIFDKSKTHVIHESTSGRYFVINAISDPIIPNRRTWLVFWEFLSLRELEEHLSPSEIKSSEDRKVVDLKKSKLFELLGQDYHRGQFVWGEYEFEWRPGPAFDGILELPEQGNWKVWSSETEYPLVASINEMRLEPVNEFNKRRKEEVNEFNKRREAKAQKTIDPLDLIDK